MPTMTSKDRAAAYARLAARYDVLPEGAHTMTDDQLEELMTEARYSGQEDAAEYMLDVRSGEVETFGRFAVVTMNGEHYYADVHDTIETAKREAIANLADPMYEQTPVEIVDLERGTKWSPKWETVEWAEHTA